MNQTANYQLSQWEATDRFLMSDFNSDNSKIDAALKANAEAIAAEAAARQAQPSYEKLKTVTIATQGNGLDVDISGIDWGSYQEVLLLAELQGSGYGALQINGGIGGESYVQFAAGSGSGYGVAHTYFYSDLWVRFLVGGDGQRRINAISLGNGLCYCLSGTTKYQDILPCASRDRKAISMCPPAPS